LPLVDVDYSIAERTCLKNGGGIRGREDERNQTHIQAIRELKERYNDCCYRLHSPRTLPESSYDFLQSDDLARRDRSQVLTLYLEAQKAHEEAELSAPGLKSVYTRHSSMISKPAVPKTREAAMTYSLWKTLKTDKSASSLVGTYQRNDDPIRPKMLMVPQLWLWKLDERQLHQIGVTPSLPLNSKPS
jgi:hypothetical protein